MPLILKLKYRFITLKKIRIVGILVYFSVSLIIYLSPDWLVDLQDDLKTETNCEIFLPIITTIMVFFYLYLYRLLSQYIFKMKKLNK